MKRLHPLLPPLASLALGFITLAASAEPGTPSVEELWKIIQEQQAEIESLKRQQQNTDRKAEAAGEKAVTADKKAEAAAVAVEESSA